jgi:uncharacterized protein YkwD
MVQLPFFRAAAVIATLALPLGGAACTGSTAADDGPSQANPLDGEEASLMAGLNMLRASQTPPLPSIAVCFSLDISASAHSDDMRDHNYLAQSPPDDASSTVRTRACTAGYAPACSGNIAMGEVLAEGFGSGATTLTGWEANPTSDGILLNATFIVGGVGRAIGATTEMWTLDLAAVTDPSCQ